MDLDPREPLVSHKDPQHHVTSPMTYFVIFGLLMIGTAITVGAAYVDFGLLNTPIAFTIATAKASIVVLYFMHVRHSTRLTWLIVIGSVFWLGVLFVLTFTDYLSRFWPTVQ